MFTLMQEISKYMKQKVHLTDFIKFTYKLHSCVSCMIVSLDTSHSALSEDKDDTSVVLPQVRDSGPSHPTTPILPWMKSVLSNALDSHHLHHQEASEHVNYIASRRNWNRSFQML